MTKQETSGDSAELVREIGARAKAVAHPLGLVSGAARSTAIRAAAAALKADSHKVLEANQQDLALGHEAGLTAAMLDRLSLTPDRLAATISGLEDIANAPDPVGKILEAFDRPNGLRIERRSVPLGVVGCIYESRPNVTVDAAGLCLKSGNAAILRCGSDCFETSTVMVAAIRAGLDAAGLDPDSVQLIPTRDRAAVGTMLSLEDSIDIIVPRGGRKLIERVSRESRIPVIKHLDGLCHVYIHGSANPEMALEIAMNAKMRRVSICGAAETLLIDVSAATTQLPQIGAALTEAGCEIRGDSQTCALIPNAIPATDADWDTEYLDAILSIKCVESIEEALAHIQRYGSQHTDAIVAEDAAAATRFLSQVDSAVVLHNASTQFSDGGEFGYGAEIGISTGKIHARGPVGAQKLTSYKYWVLGQGQCRP